MQILDIMDWAVAQATADATEAAHLMLTSVCVVQANGQALRLTVE